MIMNWDIQINEEIDLLREPYVSLQKRILLPLQMKLIETMNSHSIYGLNWEN